MNVRELIQELERFDSEDEVLIAYEYGDHCHTLAGHEPEEVDCRQAKWSDYHLDYKILRDDDEIYEGEEEKYKYFVVIK